ncbi:MULTISPECIES: helix-turn-helix domain-containing protein [unclassified Aureimonas]|uniref:helix-turn-helix domain-containing protein n=1 Tax=unclassified Aureimonas TaxID=2615206 RepID=UPI000AE903CE|nr:MULTISPECIES: helix-turn-helix domain-containing protein [unclassified Aureimonas]
MTLTEFASALGIGTRAVRRIPVLDDVLPRGRGGSSRLYFSPDDLAVAKDAIDTAMTAVEARTALGLRVVDLPKLEAARLVRCVPHRLWPLNSKAYLRADVDALLERIDAFEVTDVPSVGFERMVTAMRVTSGALACRVMAGEVRPLGVGGRGRGFRSLRFDAAEAGVAATEPGKSVTDAAVRLGVSPPTVRMLVETGRLDVIGRGIWRGGICPASLESFADAHVSTEHLVVPLGCHPRGVASRLAAMGVQVLKVGRDSIGLVTKADAARVLLHRKDAAPASSTVDEPKIEGLPKVRRWRPARIGFGGEGIVYVATTKRVTATLTLRRKTELAVDCSRASGGRRFRIAGLVGDSLAVRLPGFRMERGAEGRCVLWATLDSTGDDGEGLAARNQWIEARLNDLADVFTLIDAEERLLKA